MPGYTATDQQTLIATPDTVITVTANASVAHRIKLIHFLLGFIVPGDFTSVITIGNVTGLGTGDALSEVPLDPGDRASQAVATGNQSAEPTYTNDILDLPLSHRGTAIWWAAPEFEPVSDGSVDDGFGIKAGHATVTDDYLATIGWRE